MRKLLLSLFALLTASVAVADNYLYVDSTEVCYNQWGTVLRVPVRAHFDARVQRIYLDCWSELGVEDYELGKDLSVNYYDENGVQQTATPTMYSVGTRFTDADFGFDQQGYWDPDGTGNYQCYGNVKWEPGDYEEFFVLYIKIPDDFYGGDFHIITEASATQDARGGTVLESGENGQSVIKQSRFYMPKTEAPKVLFTEDADTLTVTVTGEGQLIVNWEYVNDSVYSFTVVRDYEPQLIQVWASAEAYGKEPSDEVYASYEFAAKERPVYDAPTIAWSYTDTTMILSCQGYGSRYLFVNGQPVTNPYTIPRTDRDSVIMVSAYAQGGIALPSDTVYRELTIPGLNSEITPKPSISIGQYPEYFRFTLNGKGTLKLYVDGKEVENSYDFPRPAPRDPDVSVFVCGTAQEDGKYISPMSYIYTWVPHKVLVNDFVEDSVYYLIVGDHKVYVATNGYVGNAYSGEVSVPDYVTHEGVTYMVTGVDNGAFSDCENLTGVTLGNNITRIGDESFYGCKKLKSITFGDYVISVGRLAFFNCTSLESVVMGSGMDTIAWQAFGNCNALTNILCKAAAPPALADETSISNYRNVTLHVHPAVLELYQAADYWKDCSNIIDDYHGQPAAGDVNGDGKVSIGDVTRLIDMLLGDQ